MIGGRAFRSVLAGLAALIWSAGLALGHASLIAADPPDGAVLQTAPPVLSLTFSEPARPLVARLTAATGESRLLDPPQVQGNRLIYAMPPDLDRGSHLLSWRVTSGDGHPVAGASLFSLGEATGAIQAAPGAPPATRAGLWLLRAVLVATLLIGVGGAVFRAFLSDEPRRGSPVAAGAGLLALPLVWGFQGLDLLALSPAGLLTSAPWREGAAGAPGLALALAAAALLAACLPGRIAALLALLLAGAAAASSGHAATAAPGLLMRPAVAAHVLAAALWIGALVPLLADLARGRCGALRWFSRLIPWVLAVVLASGTAIALVQLGRPAALWSTDYGRVLLVKLGLVALMLAVALANRLLLAPRAMRGDGGPLRLAIEVELALVVLIVATVALWRYTPPPRSLPSVLPEIRLQLASPALSAEIGVSPPRVGLVSVTVSDLRVDGEPVTPKSVEVELSKPAYGLGPFRHEAAPDCGVVDAGRFLLPLDGYWVLTLRVLVSDFRVEELRDLIEIAPAS
ncbi:MULTISPECIES: copper resistance CopC/CopD family protein [Paracoccus]|jgi:copper transport protein|uniref:copper resistance CopC/CopD family protein n=1 Tax=Paracoccus TaxID=265 RepID=UPI002586E3A5|nr:CopD family protein [Paracoccus sp. (in: a-proteobacteria)]